MVFCGLFPVDAADFEDLRAAIGQAPRSTTPSFSYEMETSAALGFGFRCGFLGLLHLEIIQERLEREFDLDLITTAPSVVYRIRMTDGTEIELHNPADMPDLIKHRRDRGAVDQGDDPRPPTTISATILKLCQDRRGIQIDLTYVGNRAMVVYDLPLNEVVFDFYDRLKSVSKGYASLRLPASPTTARATSSRCRSSSTTSRSTRSRCWSTATGPRCAAAPCARS